MKPLWADKAMSGLYGDTCIFPLSHCLVRGRLPPATRAASPILADAAIAEATLV